MPLGAYYSKGVWHKITLITFMLLAMIGYICVINFAYHTAKRINWQTYYNFMDKCDNVVLKLLGEEER